VTTPFDRTMTFSLTSPSSSDAESPSPSSIGITQHPASFALALQETPRLAP
jgi:hypothetical protein